MFTNNFIKWTKLLFSGAEQSVVMVNGSSHPILSPCIMNQSDTLGYFMIKAQCKEIATSQSSAYQNASGVYFGSGSTAETADDYKLESPITSGLTIQNQASVNISYDSDGVYTAFAAFVVTNTSDAEITIREVGLFGELAGKFSTSSASIYYRPCLLERQVLSDPITIAPGTSKLVTYKITFNQTVV